jgi:hypothetical protein
VVEHSRERLHSPETVIAEVEPPVSLTTSAAGRRRGLGLALCDREGDVVRGVDWWQQVLPMSTAVFEPGSNLSPVRGIPRFVYSSAENRGTPVIKGSILARTLRSLILLYI